MHPRKRAKKVVKVLIVDNDRDMCKVIADILKEEGVSVSIASNGEAALKKIEKQSCDAMILDYKLSGISGLTVLEKARQLRPSITTIMISGYGNSAVRKRAQGLGAYAFLDKPFNIKVLAKVVKKALKEKKGGAV